MNLKKLLLVFPLIIFARYVHAQDNYLVAKRFFVHKGDKIDVLLLTGEQFRDADEYKYDAAKTIKFMLYDAGKKINLMTAAKDSAAPVLTAPADNQGLLMVEMIRKVPPTETDREAYGKYLTDEGLNKLADMVNNSNQANIKEKKTSYMKTLLMVDKPTGGDYDKLLGDDLEIVLKKNPYKLNYGDDLTGVLYAKGKPVKTATIDVYLKSEKGNIYTEKLITDDKGGFTVLTNREGIYLLRNSSTIASTSTDADFETTQAEFTFLFNSTNDHTADYKSFGLTDRKTDRKP